MSAYGCWMSTKKISSEDGVSTYKEEEFKDKIKLQSPHAQKEIHQKAGFLGSLMQAVYQVCPSRFAVIIVSYLLAFLSHNIFFNSLVWFVYLFSKVSLLIGPDVIFFFLLIIVSSVLNSQLIIYYAMLWTGYIH